MPDDTPGGSSPEDDAVELNRSRAYLAKILSERVNKLKATLEAKAERIDTLEAEIERLNDELAARDQEIEQPHDEQVATASESSGESETQSVWRRLFGGDRE